ncbi:hypothetical protein Tco_1562607 [Tanacetum coccineum]
MLQNIQCSPECKIVGHLLLYHPLSYALTTTAGIPVFYLQQFWNTVSKVLDTKDTIRFKLDRQEIVYTVDMYRSTLQLPMETLTNPFIAPTTMTVFNRCLTTRTSRHDQTKINILQIFHAVVNCTHVDYVALIWWDFLNCVLQKKDDYHYIKDDIPLVSVYSMGNVTVLGMLISDAFITDEICASDDYKKYETVFARVVVPMIQPQPVVST